MVAAKGPAAAQGAGEEQASDYPYPFPPPGLHNFYDPFAGPHPAGYGAPYPVEYDSFAAPHPSEMYPNADYLYDRPVMYNDLPAYMPSYKDLLDRKARKVDSLGREVQEKTGTRKEISETMVPPARVATQGYRPGMHRGAMPTYQVGAGFQGERSAQGHHHIPDQRSQHKTDWVSWTREESGRIRRTGDEEFGNDGGRGRAPYGRSQNQVTNATMQQSRAHGNVISSTKPLMTL